MKSSYKIVILGDSRVGKTTLIRKLKDLKFMEGYNPTISFSLNIISFKLKNGDQITLKFWDISGSCKEDIRDQYYRGVDGAIIVGDSTNQVSIDNMEKWTNEILEYNPDTHITKVINKTKDMQSIDNTLSMNLENSLGYFEVIDDLVYKLCGKRLKIYK